MSNNLSVSFILNDNESTLVKERVSLLSSNLSSDGIDSIVLTFGVSNPSLFTDCQLKGALFIYASIESLIESQAYGFIAESAFLWCDPEVAFIDDSAIKDSIVQSVIDTGIKVIATSESSSEAWFSHLGYKPAIISPYPPFNFEKVNPLIEKGARGRVLVDGTNATSTTPFVEAFVALDSFDIEVWSISSDTLKSWMKPDMHFEEISESEWALYCLSIDFLVIASHHEYVENRIRAAVSCGVFPIFIADFQSAYIEALERRFQVPAELSPKDKIKWYLHNAENLVESRSALREFNNEYPQSEGLVELMTQHSLPVKDWSECSLSANKWINKYIEWKYGEPESITRHDIFKRYLELQRQKDVEFSGSYLIEVVGWSGDTERNSATDIIAVNESGPIPIIRNEIYRPDVIEHLKSSADQTLGFDLKLISNFSYEPTSQLSIWSSNAICSVSKFNNQMGYIGDASASRSIMDKYSIITDHDGRDVELIESPHIVSHIDSINVIEGSVCRLSFLDFASQSPILKIDGLEELQLNSYAINCFIITKLKEETALIQSVLYIDGYGDIRFPSNLYSKILQSDDAFVWLPYAGLKKGALFSEHN